LAKGPGVAETFKRLWPYLSRYRGRAVAVVLLGAIAAVGSKANLALLKPLVNLLFPGESVGPAGDLSGLDKFDAWLSEVLQGVSVFGTNQTVSTVLVISATLLLSALLFASIQFFFLRLSRMLGVWMVTDLRQDLAAHVLDLDLSYHSKRRLGDLMSRLTSDVGTSLRVMLLVVEELVQEPFNVLGGFFMAYLAAPKATLGMLIFLPILALPVIKLGPKVRRRSAKSQARLGDATQTMMQMFSGIREVKVFGMEQREVDEYRKTNQNFVKQTDKMVKTQAMSLAMTNFFSFGGIGLVVGAIALLNQFTPLFKDAGSMMAFFAAVAVMFNSVKRLTKAASIVYTSMGATQRVFEVFDLQPEIGDGPNPRNFSGLQSGIEFRDLNFSYANGKTANNSENELAIKDLNLSVAKGQTVALVGASGAGKSTLLDLVARFFDPQAGVIEVDGIDLRELKLADWLKNIAVVSQRPFLFQTSLRENVRYGRPEASDAEIEAACRAAFLDDFIDALPQGLDTEIGEAGSRLSGGQAQRVTIARAILKNADVLLLDEATSSLDSESERRVQKALEALMEGRTTIVIAHRLSTVLSADRIYVLDEGRLVEAGTHEELLAEQGAYAKLWAIQTND